MKKVTSVDDYINAQPVWKVCLERLREIVHKTEMVETVKWGAPAYTVNGKNVIGIVAFKSFFAIWFMQGALLKDKHGKLINAQKGVTRALRQWRFSSLEEIEENLIIDYLQEAIENQKLGREIKAVRGKPLIVPDELQAALQDKGLTKTFDSLSLTCKRQFAAYISNAKRGDTKLRRLEKIIPMISKKIGLYD
ncbi:MAG: hypothetical protein HKN85_09395 [Gammaproteobacteria bacterium]|nr:hypothetical protein [Gammaproteobacteria bacterium]